MNLDGVESIIFDLGGVILNIDYNKSVEAFQKLGANDFDAMYSQAQQSDLFDRLELGEISPSHFRNELRNSFQVSWTDEAIDSAWNAMLLDLPPQRVQLLKDLSKKYRLFLLSNTNAIHYQAYSEYVNERYGLGDLSELFEKAYFSHLFGKRKPFPETFLQITDINGLSPSNCLFIDDSIQHIKGAEKAGLRVFHHIDGDISDCFML